MFNTIRFLKLKITFTALVVVMICFASQSHAQQKFSKATFYAVMDSSEVAAIDDELALIKVSSLTEKDGYEGALLMRKAGKTNGAKKKLDLFKAGRIKLETAIAAEPDNTEFRFLRLAIEEHAPKIVKYHSDIDYDKLMIKKNFKSLPESVRHAIISYAKKSKILHAEDF